MELPTTLTLGLILLLQAGCGLFDQSDIESFTLTPISAVEVALEIRADAGDNIRVERDGKEICAFRMSRKDTVIYDSGLTPATSYIWKVTNESSRRDRSKERQATTYSTTSSDFTWQTFTFGEHSSSVLYGVSIIDENNIWAVGEIYMNDSTGQADSKIYNAIHFNGVEWVLKRIEGNFRGNRIIPPLEGIHAFSESNIWAAGSLPVRGDGENWEIIDLRTIVDESLSLWKVWEKDTSEVYFGGKSGSMAYFNGQTWQKIETGTELDIEDIHGNAEQGVVAVASKLFETLDNAIFRIKEDKTAEEVNTEGIPEPISGIWFDETGVTYIVGSGMFKKPGLEAPVSWQDFHLPITNNYMDAIDANGLSDIVVSGNSGEILHFNGAGWTNFQNGLAGTLYDIDIHQGLVVAVGYDGGKAFITMGVRE